MTPGDIAIVGMACVFPSAPDLASFWAGRILKRDSRPVSGTLHAPQLEQVISDALAGRAKPAAGAVFIAGSAVEGLRAAMDKLLSGACDTAVAGSAGADYAGALVLRRLEDSRREGEAIYAVIKEPSLEPALDLTGSGESELAALFSAVLAVREKIIPPTQNPEARARPWIHGSPVPRRSALHGVVMEEWLEPNEPETPLLLSHRDSEAFLLSAGSRAELLGRARNLRQAPEPALAVNATFPAGDFRLSLIAGTEAELCEKLDRAIQRLSDPKCRTIREPRGIYYFEPAPEGQGKLAFLFPGEGSQYPNMLADLCWYFPRVRRRFDLADRVAARHGGVPPSHAIFPSTGSTSEASLWEMYTAVSAVIASNIALFDLLTSFGIRPDAVTGHSSGEFSSLLASGAFDSTDDESVAECFADLRQAYQRILQTEGIVQMELWAVGADSGRVSTIILEADAAVRIANENCSLQTVICGDRHAVEPVLRRLRSKGVLCNHLAFDRPYHTPEFQPYLEPLRNFFRRWLKQPPAIPTYSCGTQTLFPPDLERCRSVATGQWVLPVKFRATIEQMYGDGIRTFIEVGAKGNLSAFVSDILRGRPHVAIAANIEGRSGLAQLQHTIGVFAARGGNPDLGGLYPRRPVKKSAPASPQRQRIMNAYLANMQSFLQVQQEVMSAYLNRPAPRRTELPPLLDAVESAEPGRNATAIVLLDIARHLYLKDHTFGRDISVTDPELRGVPVLPLTMGLEIMAEAAALVFPPRRTVTFQDIRAYRWVTAESPTKFRVVANAAGPGTTQVSIVNHGDQSTPPAPLMDCVVVFGDDPPAEPAETFPLRSSRPSGLCKEKIYRDVMFHGPSFQSVKSIDLYGDDGLTATIDILPRSRLLQSNPAPKFLVDPILIDVMSHAFGCWLMDQQIDSQFFPYHVKQIDCYRIPPPGEIVTCRVRAAIESDRLSTADMEAISGNRLICRCTGWGTRRFPMPVGILRLWHWPLRATSSEPWRVNPGRDNHDLAGRRLRIDADLRDLFASAGGIFLRTAANAILSHRERKFWQEARFGDGRRIEWLCGRLAAKEAVREYLQTAFGLALCPADIEIQPDERGRPLVSGLWTERVPGIPRVTISHSNGTVVAIAGDAGRPVGVDIEPLNRLDRFDAGRFEKSAFSTEEQRLIDSLADEDRTAATLRIWCAKEAAAKAMGIGLSSGLLSARAESIENRDGGVAVQVRIGREGAVTAFTTIEDNYVVAICTQESAMYQEAG